MSLDEIKQPSEETSEEFVDSPSAKDNTLEEAFSSFTEVNYANKKPVKTRKFSKRTISLIVTSGAAVVLAVVLLLVTLLPNSGADVDSGSADNADVDTSVVLLDKSNNNSVTVSQIDCTNKDGKYTLFYNNTEKIFQLKGYEDILLSEELTNTVSTYSSLLKAADQVKSPKELSTYGLDDPIASATITYQDGSTAVIHVGDITPSEMGYYVRIEGIDGVYIFESDSVYAYTIMAAAYADTTLISTPSVKKDDENGSAVMKEIRYTGKKYPQPLHIRRSFHTDMEELTYYSYIISEPYLRGTSDAASGLFTNFKSLSAVQALILHPTEEQKKRAGFEDPLSVIQVTLAVETPDESDTSETDDAEINKYYNETVSTITVANTDEDGNYIVMVNGIDAIFLVDAATFSSVAERDYANSVNPLLFAKNITKLNRIVIKTSEVECDLKLEHFPEAEEADDEMKITQGSETYSTEEFRELYTLMMSIMRYDTWTEELPDTSDLTIYLYNSDGSLFLGADFYSISGSRYAVKTTEGELFTTRSAEVSHFIKQIVNYLNHKDVLTLT